MIKKDLSIEFLGVKFKNPFMLSSSPVGNCYDMCAKAFRLGWGGIVYKTLIKDPCDECSPRYDTLRKEGTSFVGFKNMEQLTEHPLEDDLRDIRRLKKEFPDGVLVASIMAGSDEDWKTLAKQVEDAGADMIELNFSCPQMTDTHLGSAIGQNPDLCRQYCKAVKSATKLPVIAKMTPNITDMVEVAYASMEGGADAISCINTIKAILNVDLDKEVGLPIVNGKSSISGYSGKAVKPVALRFIQQLRDNPKTRDVPISGIGGIETWRDAAEFILVGASTLQVTTAIMQYGYRIIDDLCSGLMHYMDEKGVDHLSELVGLANKNIIPAEELDRDFKIYPKIDNDKCVGCGRCFISCYDGSHQAMEWDKKLRRPTCNTDKCVGCLLCSLVCPVGAISKGEVVFKPGRGEKRKAKDIVV